MTDRVVVLCGTIPWRVPACEQMLLSLTAQTRKPDEVIVHLDGFGPSDTRPKTPSPDQLTVRFTHSDKPRGLGSWWYNLGGGEEEDVIMPVGDDFVYFPEYVESGLQALHAHGGAVSWHAWAPNPETGRLQLYNFRANVEMHVPGVIRAGTACFFTRRKHLLGMTDHPEAPVFFHPKGHEEALVSFWLWKNNVPITRPRGKPALDLLPLGRDPRSSSVAFPQHKKALRRTLHTKYGWPGGLA